VYFPAEDTGDLMESQIVIRVSFRLNIACPFLRAISCSDPAGLTPKHTLPAHFVWVKIMFHRTKAKGVARLILYGNSLT
jgi:hypothetical protein